MLNTEKEILEVCEKENKHIYDLVIEQEKLTGKKTEEEIRRKIDGIIETMENSAKANLDRVTESKFHMIDGFSKMCNDYAEEMEPLTGSFLMKTMAMAFSTSEVNCAMGKIVAAPTAGSAGILPAAVAAAKERYGFDRETVENGVLTGIGIGQIIGKYATFAGAEGGCQAECGSASAMAAAALTEMMGGTPKQCLTAAGITILNVLGLVCDPVAGLVQYPCAFRNASGVVNSMIATDMALAGVTSIVPFEEVCQAMKEVGDSLDKDLRETGLGGIAGTKTGKRIRKEFLSEDN